MTWTLPESLTVGDSAFAIRTDFRDILRILEAYNDPNLPDWAKTEVMMKILYVDFDAIPEGLLQEAADKAIDFIDMGMPGEKGPRLMDWEQDAPIIIPAINKVAGHEVRAEKYIHWWTFLGYYMEIGDSLFTQVVSIRDKKARGKKLEKWEKEFESSNKNLVRLKAKLTDEEAEQEKAERDALRELIGD